jgi:FtsH-binding integral membrane protein
MRLLVAFALATIGAVGMIVFVFVPFYLDFDTLGWMACVCMCILSSALFGYGCNEWEREKKENE